MALSRRAVLALGSLSAVAVAGGGAALVGGAWWDPPAAEGYEFLSPEEAAFIRALAGAAYPATPQIPHSGDALDIDRFFDTALRNLPAGQRKLARLGLHALDAWTLASHGAAFHALEWARQVEVVDAWREHSRSELRNAASSLLLVAGMGFCTHPKVSPFFQAWHKCGYGR